MEREYQYRKNEEEEQRSERGIERQGAGREIVDYYLLRMTKNHPLVSAILWQLTH